jgi:hypothetical protein
VKRHFALFIPLVLAGCGGAPQGWKADEHETRAWLPKAVPHLREALILLRTCHPARPDRYLRVWTNGHNGGSVAAHCTFGSDAAIPEIQSALRRAGVLSVDYKPSGSPEVAVPSASFALHSSGISVSGSITAVDYNHEPQPCSPPGQDPASRSSVKPLTTPPCRWFWRYES